MLATEPPYPLSRRETLLYAAGLFDGEGCITLSRPHNGVSKALRVSLYSTCPDLLSFMEEAFGGKVYRTTRRADNRRDIGFWALSSTASVGFLKEIYPFLKESRKKERARLVVERLAPLMGNTRPTKEQLELRARVSEEILSV